MMQVIPTQMIPQPTRSLNNNMFVRSAYWRTWSRILQERTARGEIYTVEVNLTPVNISFPHSWAEQVAPIIIRRHMTDRSHGDTFVGTLPAEVIEKMHTFLPFETVERLLHEDFLPKIDWDKYPQQANGGAKFELIRL
jgi:hypothetical protein